MQELPPGRPPSPRWGCGLFPTPTRGRRASGALTPGYMPWPRWGLQRKPRSRLLSPPHRRGPSATTRPCLPRLSPRTPRPQRPNSYRSRWPL